MPLSTALSLPSLSSRVRSLLEIRLGGGRRAKSYCTLVALVYLFTWLRQRQLPEVFYRRTKHNVRMLSALAGVLDLPYLPSWLTPNAHVNCLLGYAKRGPALSRTREIVRTWDGGNFALDWRNRDEGESDLTPETPTVLVIHGLNGSSSEGCILYAMDLAHSRGWRAVAMNHRGCGGTFLSSGWTYNGAFTGDVRLAVSHIRHRYPMSPVFAVGYSLGANLLVKYLGEEGSRGDAPLSGAVSVSNPWNFENNSIALSTDKDLGERVLGRFYSMALAIGIKRSLREHMDSEFLVRRKELDIKSGMRVATVPEYDRTMVLPMWGYQDLHEYHRDGSSSRYVGEVKTPLLCINAKDDPICQPSLWPLEACQRNPSVVFVSTRAGGHIGWGEGFNPWTRCSWADKLIVDYIAALLVESGGKGTQTPLHSSGVEIESGLRGAGPETQPVTARL